ncbi:hypothetical protein JXR93_14055 [bacterium]|nr:hypothetical protein [bacterium]
MHILGIILIVVGAILAFLAFRAKDKILALRAVEVKPVKDHLEIYGEVAKDLDGMDNKPLAYVAVYGKTVSDSPLKAPLSNTPCVYYSLLEEYEVEKKEQYEERDSEGNVQKKTRTVREWRTGSSDIKFTQFKVKDSSGEILVNPAGLKYDLAHNKKVETHPVQQEDRGLLGNFLSALTNQEKVIAHRKTESIVPVDFQVFLTAGIIPSADGLYLGETNKKEEPFNLADRSQDTLIKDLQSQQKMMNIAGISLGVIGLVLTIIGFVK